jgi:hypothetical protein
LKLLGVLALVALVIVGCGDTGATSDELHEARVRGEKAGRTTAEADVSSRIARARENAYWEGNLDGEEEAYELEEEFDREQEEEVEGEEGEFDPTPEKLNGEDSYEFEPDDLERAEEADEELREYCAGAVSPAQELGCLSHTEAP